MITNLTPHVVTVHPDGADGPAAITIPPSGTVARPLVISERVGEVDRVPIVRATNGSAVGLPHPVEGQYLLVSPATAEAAYHSGRPTLDLLTVGEPVRNDAGRVIGCQALVAWRPVLSRRQYLESLEHHAVARYRSERRRDPDFMPQFRHLSAAAAVAECLVIGLADPGEHGQSLLAAVTDVVTVGFQAIASHLIAARREIQEADARLARSRKDTEQ